MPLAPQSWASRRPRSCSARSPSSVARAAAADSAASISAMARSASVRAAAPRAMAAAERPATSCQRACADSSTADTRASAVTSRLVCCSACAASRRACGRNSATMSSTRVRFASDSTSCSWARRRRRSWRRTPATSSKSGRRSSGRSASAWSTMPWPMNRNALSARCAESSRSTRSRSRIRCLFRRYSFSPDRYRRRPSSSTENSTGSSPSALSTTSVTSAMPWAARLSEPAQMTSSDLRERSALPCSPSAQRSASARLLLPDPFGPTTALMPPPNSTLVRSANDLKPCSRRARRRAAAGPCPFRSLMR